MTEQEWLKNADPEPLLDFVRGKVSNRKLRLFAVACSRSVWQLLFDERSRKAIFLAERFADGEIGEKDLEDAEYDAISVIGSGHFISLPAQYGIAGAVACCAATTDAPYVPVNSMLGSSAYDAALSSSRNILRLRETGQEVHLNIQCLLRDICGNPFRPVTVDPSWLTGNVTSLATGIYADRAFDRLPILGDALEDAGCTHTDMLNHCRQPGEHVRGCWCVDLVLQKK